jgi:tetratricopeptide (TPR) repeat protein
MVFNRYLRNYTVLFCCSVIVIVIAIYHRVIEFDFINYDDNHFLTDNEFITNGLTREGIQWAFSNHFFFGFSRADYWAPLTHLSHMLDFQIYGMNPSGHHLTNILIHITNAILCFITLKRLTKKLWESTLVSVLFTIHPINVEAVCWIIERKGLLAALFTFLTILSYHKFTKENKSTWWYLLSLVLFQLGLMAKISIIPLPLWLLILDVWPLKRFKQFSFSKENMGLIVEKVPFFIISAIAAIQGLLFMKNINNMIPVQAVGIYGRIGQIVENIYNYTTKLAFPTKLSIFYPLERVNLFSYDCILKLCLVILVITLILLISRRHIFVLSGSLLYITMLIPTIGIVQAGSQSIADRYLYIAQLGFFIIIVFSFSNWCSRRNSKVSQKHLLFPVIICILMSAIAHRQSLYWKNSETILTHANDVTENNYVAYNNLGIYYVDQGNWREAFTCFYLSYCTNENFPIVYNNFGICLRHMGLHEKALEFFEKSKSLGFKFNSVYTNISNEHLALGDTNSAIQSLSLGLKEHPKDLQLAMSLGYLYETRNEFDLALQVYQNNLKYNKNKQEPYFRIGNVFQKQSKYLESVEYYRTSIMLQPHDSQAENNLGISLGRLGKFEESVSHYQKAIEINPRNKDAVYNLGIAYLNLNELRLAKKQFERVVVQNPTNSNARAALERLNKLHITDKND